MFTIECHCANTKLLTEEPPASITSCNCSICNRIGALWAYYDLEKVEVLIAEGSNKNYSWGEKALTYHRCTQCGCTTHYTANRDDGSKRIAINCRMAPLSEISNIPVRKFDGLQTSKYLNE